METNTSDLFEEVKGKVLEEKNLVNNSECCCEEECDYDDCKCDDYYSSRLLQHNELCEIIDDYLDDFEHEIKSRGKDYYEKGNIVSVVRNGNNFISKIDGTERYEVEVNFDDEDDFMDYFCTCPCDFPCKHVYAVMLAIKNKEYNEIELKPHIEKNEYTIQKLIEMIPAEDLKEYMLSEEGKNYVCFEMKHFENHFSKYLPRQTYEYYYNNLYNSLLLDGYSKIEYINIARSLINCGEYQEAFYAIKSLVEASNDVKVLDKWNELIDNMPAIGMILRIIYRKADDNVKTNIKEWIEILEENNYYNSLYLEDIVLTIK